MHENGLLTVNNATLPRSLPRVRPRLRAPISPQWPLSQLILFQQPLHLLPLSRLPQFLLPQHLLALHQLPRPFSVAGGRRRR